MYHDQSRMDSEEEIQGNTCEIIEVNQDFINALSELEKIYQEEKERIFQEIMQEIMQETTKNKNT